MFVVTRDGKKLPVDDSAFDEEKDWHTTFTNVAIYPENVLLKPVWLLEMGRNNHFYKQSEARNGNIFEWVAEKLFYSEPTKEEILWAMAAYGLSKLDLGFVRKGFMLDTEDD